MDVVAQVVENSEFARKGLREGVLNMSAYAKAIRPQVEKLTKLEAVSDSSIVMALSRYGKELRQSHSNARRGTTGSIEITTFVYRKTPEVQERLAMLLLLDSIKHAAYFTVMITTAEVTIATQSIATGTVRGHFGALRPTSQEITFIDQ